VNLPYLTADLPGIGGVLRSTHEDFYVDEEPAYPAKGEGDHVFVRFEKRGLTTMVAVERIAQALGVKVRDIGVAGMKDRHAVTRQWISLPPPITPEAVRALVIEDVAICDAVRHPHKLRTGHVRANRFVLRVKGLAVAADEAVARATAILARLARPPGAPNWYGEQRFGRDGDNAARGRAIVNGEGFPRDRKLARLLVSSLQSELFNTWLTARLADGLYETVLAGDVLHKVGGGMFTCEHPDVDTPRLVAGEVVLTGPMFGESMRRPTEGSPAAEREDAVLAAAGLARDSFATVRAIAEGTRRDATIAVADASVTAIDNAGIDHTALPSGSADSPGQARLVEVAFTLPGGAYATVVMRELMK
jgi:tRNA pseudouridine13 synthase